MPALGQQTVDLPAIDHLAFTQSGWQRPLLELRQGVAQVARAQLVDSYQQGAGIVLAAAVMGAGHEGIGGFLQVGVFAQDRLDMHIAQAGPHAVAEQHEALAFVQIAFQIVHQQLLVQPQRALEHVLHAGLVPHMVFTQALQLVVLPAVHPAVADVGEGEASPAQHQGAEGGEQRLAIALGAQPAVLRHQQTVQGLGHAPGGGRGVVVEGQGLQAGACCQAAVGALADAVGQRAQVAFAGCQFGCRGDQAHGILVFRARACGAGLGEAQ